MGKMTEDFDQSSSHSRSLEQYWGIVSRRRWWIVLPVFVVWAAVWGISWFLPASYRSETLILIEQQKVPEQYVVLKRGQRSAGPLAEHDPADHEPHPAAADYRAI